jgi:hypothetical protein
MLALLLLMLLSPPLSVLPDRVEAVMAAAAWMLT